MSASKGPYRGVGSDVDDVFTEPPPSAPIQPFPRYEPCSGDGCPLDSDTAVCEEHFVNVRNTHHRAQYHKDSLKVVHLLPEGKQ